MIASFLRNALTELRANLESPRVQLSGSNVESWFGGVRKSRSGVDVGVREALSYSPVWSAVSLISEDIMRIPFLTYERDIIDGKVHKNEAINHRVHEILNGSIAPMGVPLRMTSDVWIQRIIAHALLFRGAYSRIYRDQNQRVTRLEWLHSDRVEVDIQEGVKYFRVSYDGHSTEPGHDAWERVAESDMFHINGLQIDELGGLGLVDFARNSIGRQLAAEDYGDEFFNNAGVPQGFFKSPLPMKDEAIARFMRRIARAHGKNNRHTFGLLEQGMEWEASGISPKDAMLIEVLKFGVPEIARWFKIPLNKLADPSRSGYNTTEQENIAFLNSTLGAWIRRLEMQANDKLFSETSKKRRRYYTKFKVRDYLRAEIKSRAEFYKTGIESGWMTRAEAREEEDMNPIDGLDIPIVPMNMMSGSDVDEPDVDDSDQDRDPPGDSQDEENARFSAALLLGRSVVTECVERLHKAACGASREPNKFGAALNDFEDRHGIAITKKLSPVVQVARSFACDCELTAVVDHVIEASRDAYLAASECQPGELRTRVERVKPEPLIEQISGLIFKR